VFPALTEAQMRRLISQGTPRSVRAGEVLVELGEGEIPIFVIMSGELEILRPSFAQETLIRVIGPGRFTGEINTLSGRRAFARVRARQDSEVIEITRKNLVALV
jgi:thioredoxin reductase (NADPH)